MTRILVTGSLGYIGSVLVPYLEASGFGCVGYDTGFFSGCLLYPPSPTVTYHKDARDITAADLKDVDVVVHLAGISNDPMGKLDVSSIYDPTRAYSLAIARLCKAHGVRFIFASSCSIYGLGSEELLTETSPTHPQTPYSLNKLQIEDDLRAISGKDFSPIALRFATVFGRSPRLRFDVVVNMLTGMAAANGTLVLNSDGSAWRPNVHILDACQAVRRAIEIDYLGGELLVLNVGDDANNLQVIQIARIIQGAVPGCTLKFLTENPELDAEGLIRDRKVKAGTDTRTYKVSFEKIRKTLPGFACEWTVEQGVQEMAALFRELPLDQETFKRRQFYRLQELEYRHEHGDLSDDLRWQIPRLSGAEIEDLLGRAARSPRRRHPKILHAPGDELNRVVNVMMQDTYMQPHLHPGEAKIEKIHLIAGQVAVLLFDDRGLVKTVVVLKKGGVESIEVPAFTWHTYVMLTESAITYETMMGRYEPETWKDMAAWAPRENAPESAAYLGVLKTEAARRAA
jgi:cupin fold WbuC family metalloprotein